MVANIEKLPVDKPMAEFGCKGRILYTHFLCCCNSNLVFLKQQLLFLRKMSFVNLTMLQTTNWGWWEKRRNCTVKEDQNQQILVHINMQERAVVNTDSTAETAKRSVVLPLFLWGGIPLTPPANILMLVVNQHSNVSTCSVSAQYLPTLFSAIPVIFYLQRNASNQFFPGTWLHLHI
jgi:hypothetical protein